MTERPPSAAPPGWYPEPDADGLRWWDGTSWTEHRQPATAPPTTDGGRDRSRRAPLLILFGGLAVLVVGGIAVSSVNGSRPAPQPVPITVHDSWCNYYANGTAMVFVEYSNESNRKQDIILDVQAVLNGQVYGEDASRWAIAPNASGPGALLTSEFDIDPFGDADEPECKVDIRRDPNP